MKTEIIGYTDGTFSARIIYKNKEYFLMNVHYYPAFSCNPNNIDNVQKSFIFNTMEDCINQLKLRKARKYPNRSDTIKNPIIKNEFKELHII